MKNWSDYVFGGAKAGYDKAFGPSQAEKDRQRLLDSMGGRLGDESAKNDARRRAALEQSLAMFDPVDSALTRMYGPGAAGPGVDIDSIFGPLAAPPGPGAPLPPGWDPTHQTHPMFDDNKPLPTGWAGHLSTPGAPPTLTNPMNFGRRGG